jgi:hypothetical protein
MSLKECFFGGCVRVLYVFVCACYWGLNSGLSLSHLNHFPNPLAFSCFSYRGPDPPTSSSKTAGIIGCTTRPSHLKDYFEFTSHTLALRYNLQIKNDIYSR